MALQFLPFILCLAISLPDPTLRHIIPGVADAKFEPLEPRPISGREGRYEDLCLDNHQNRRQKIQA
jgi:hypothetical protein